MIATLRKLQPYLKPFIGRFAQAASAMVVVAACHTFSVYLLKPVVDEVFVSKNEATLWMILWIIPAVFAIKSTAEYIQNYLMGFIGQRVIQELREALFRQLNTLSLDYYWGRRSGEILSRVTNDLTSVQTMLQRTPLYLVRDTLKVLGLTGILFYLNWRFALATLCLFPLVGLLVGRLAHKMRKAGSQSQALMADLYHRFSESLQGMTVIKAFNYEEGACKLFHRENQDYFNQMMRYLRAASLTGPVLEFLGSLGIVVLIYFAGREIFSGKMSTGDFFTFLGAFLIAYMSLKNLADMNVQLQMGMVSAERIFQVLDEKPSVREASSPAYFGGLTRGIEFRGLGFRYPTRETWALRGVDLKIERGKTTAFVGPSGSGKSTLVHLLLRLFDPTEGQILFDGVDLRNLSLKSFRAQVGLVTQDTVLFNDTVSHNVALGRDITRREIEAACKAANADDFIQELPQGYDTPLGDRGVRLSGGQRQRLAIARAVLTNPSLLILDEATSNLDTASERSVQEALDRLSKTRTVLVVAHRLSTIQNADSIAVLSEGRLVEFGSHESLMAAGGTYRRLSELQFSGTPAETVEKP